MAAVPEVPAPAWRPRKPARAARKPPLSTEAIVDAALRIVDAEGLDALSMRRVAQQLDTGAASLYAHVTNKDELIELVLDRVNADLKMPDPDPENWQQQVIDGMRAVRDTYAKHRDLARANFGRIPTQPNTLETMESMLAVLKAGGLPPKAISWVTDLIALYTTSAAYEQGLLGLREEQDPGSTYAYFEQIGQFFASLPPDRFPVTTELLDVLTTGDGEERFTFGAEVILLGVQAYAERMRAREDQPEGDRADG
jgi:AcrR family transcriptional regulator